MKFRDYYETLGLQRSATQDEVKQAYRKLARKYHPDVSKESDAEARFKDVGEAYEVLKDTEKRAAYDRMGERGNWQAGQDFQPPPDWDAGFEYRGGGPGPGGAPFGGEQFDASQFGDGGFGGHSSDFFESLFGQQAAQGHARRRAGQARGQDHHARILIDLLDTYQGARRNISLRLPVVDAQGHVGTQERTLDITIPKGIREGQNLRLSGQGEPGNGAAPAGDLYLEISFKPHALFRLDGADVYFDLPVTPWEAALGATVTAPTPEGTVQLNIPAGSAAGRKLRLKGKGLPGKMPGDLYANLIIALPPAQTDAEKEAYRAMAESFEFNPRAQMEGARS
jgi:curved DNA-binding protein